MVFFCTPYGITMPPKKDSRDAASKGILTEGTQALTSIHEPSAAFDDSVSIMAKLVGNSTNESSSTNDHTYNTRT